MLGSRAPTGPAAHAGARIGTSATAIPLPRAADCAIGSGVSLRLRRRRSSPPSTSSRSPSSSTTRTNAAAAPPPSVSKTTYSAPTDANPNDSDDEDLLQYPDRARWVRREGREREFFRF